MGSNPARGMKDFVKIFISILKNLNILHGSMLATREKNPVWILSTVRTYYLPP